LSCLAAAGCTAVDGRAVDVGALELDVAVVVVTDDDGTPLRLTAPFSAGAAPFGRLPSLRLDDGERAFVVGTTRAALLRDDPSLARAPLELATITLGAPPIAPALRVEAASSTCGSGSRRTRWWWTWISHPARPRWWRRWCST
jgi:hypothetical protein